VDASEIGAPRIREQHIVFQMRLIDFFKVGFGFVLWAPILIFIITYPLFLSPRLSNIEIHSVVFAIIIADIVCCLVLIRLYLLDRNVWYYKIDNIKNIQNILDEIPKRYKNCMMDAQMYPSTISISLNGITIKLSEYYYSKKNRGIQIKFGTRPSNQSFNEIVALINETISLHMNANGAK
jgi:hypothetical protein